MREPVSVLVERACARAKERMLRMERGVLCEEKRMGVGAWKWRMVASRWGGVSFFD